MSGSILKNNHLEITISEPGSVYKGSRFDWTGIITDITYLKQHTFAVPESYDSKKGTGGLGFCNEFGIEQVIGYDDCNPGELFPKIGVGLLKRDKEDYFFAKPYEILSVNYEVVNVTDHRYEVHSTFKKSTNFDCQLKKIVSINDNTLTLNYTLSNQGTAILSTDEYNHNFIGINQTPINEDYRLDVPIAKTFNLTAGACVINDQTIGWNDVPKEDFYLMVELSDANKDYNWNLFHSKSGVGVKEISSFPISKCAIWGSGHVVCPELFFQIDLEPNGSITWERKYEFYTK